jgi:DNA polymerase-3 subunit epsilon
VRHRAFFRFLLPLGRPRRRAAAPRQPPPLGCVHGDSRPEYYDFDLFARARATHALADRRLAELAYTVFDTETTGLDPAGGDRIIQIGAVRWSTGKLRGRSASTSWSTRSAHDPGGGIPIHGITPEMVAGKPTIEQVLPAFHAYAQDTVLVAHNAAFDMRFLQLQEATGCASSSRCSTRCCCRRWCTRSRNRTGWRPSPSASKSP